MKMFKKLPEKARVELVYNFTREPMTLNVVAFEIKNDTLLGKNILWALGYTNKDENEY